MKPTGYLFSLKLCLILLSLKTILGQDPARVYMYRQILDSDGDYELKWNINETAIEFEVTVRTTGYIGFGLSDEGRMSPADMVIGWVDVLGPQESNIYFGVKISHLNSKHNQ